MSAHTTLTIPRRAALRKIRKIDWSDIPDDFMERLERCIPISLRFFDFDSIQQMLSRQITWENVSNEGLEEVLDVILYDTLYNFTIIGDERYDECVGDQGSFSQWVGSIAHLNVPSKAVQTSYEMSYDQRQTFDFLKNQGYENSAIMTLIRSKEDSG